jgi:hypothetical protein
MPRQPSTVDGNRIFYHFLQQDLLNTDIWLFQMFTTRLIVSLGVWFSPTIYERMPVLLPYAARDPNSRGNSRLRLPDMWGSPNESGWFRDDNSLVKGLPRSLEIASARNRLYRGARLGHGWVAAHVWRELPDGSLASRDPSTYSFVPNLVWLPSQVAALTDREGSFVQNFTQALSIKIFKDHPVHPHLAGTAKRAWRRLPVPPGIPEQGLPDLVDLNFFEPTPAWWSRRIAAIKQVADALDQRVQGKKVSGKVIATRYAEGLQTLPQPVAAKLRRELLKYLRDP